MGLIVKPYTFTSGILAKAVEVNSDMDTLYNAINGGLDSSNFSANVSFPATKIDVNDTAGYYSGSTIETVLAELGQCTNKFTLDQPSITIRENMGNSAGGGVGSAGCATIVFSCRRIGFEIKSGSYTIMNNVCSTLQVDSSCVFGITQNTTASIISGINFYLYAMNISGTFTLGIGRYNVYDSTYNCGANTVLATANVSCSMILVNELPTAQSQTMRNIARLECDFYASQIAAGAIAATSETGGLYKHFVFKDYFLDGNRDVEAAYRSTNAHTAGNTGASHLDFATKIYDSHEALLGAGSSTWSWVCPDDGLYLINYSVTFAHSTTAGQYDYDEIWVNGSATKQYFNGWKATAAGSTSYSLTRSDTISLRRGDWINIRFYYTGGTSGINSTDTYTILSIKKVGKYAGNKNI